MIKFQWLETIRSLFILLFITSFVIHLASAQEYCERSQLPNDTAIFEQCNAISKDKLNVAIRHAPPFVYEALNPITGQRELEGIAVDLWQTIALTLGLEYNYVCKGLSDTLDLLTSGDIDIAISPLTITKEREKRFDFSHQYFNSGLVFASSPSETSFNFTQAFKTLGNTFSSKNSTYIMAVVGVLILLLVCLSLLNIRCYEAMPAMRNKPALAKFFHVMLYSVLNVFAIRKDVFGFSSVAMQLFSFLILLFGITVSASLLSMLTAALTQSVSPKMDFSVDSIDSYQVVTLKGSTAERFLCDSDTKPRSLTVTSTWQDALSKVTENTNHVVLGDWVQLLYLAQNPEFAKKITVHDQSFKFEPYGWGLRTDHPLRDPINQELIGILRGHQGKNIVNRYIGDQQISMKIE